jgi:IMP dehydrogenase
VAIVPSRRTRDPDDVDISWQIDAYAFGLPMMAAAMDAGVSPATAVRIGQLGGLACLNLEGLWTRYEDPEPIYEEIGTLPDEKATARMQELYREPLKDELVERRIREIKEAGVVSCASLPPSVSSGMPRRSSAPASTSS